MSTQMNIDDLIKLAESKSITADELDLLVAKTKELTLHKTKELDKLTQLLERLESKLQEAN